MTPQPFATCPRPAPAHLLRSVALGALAAALAACADDATPPDRLAQARAMFPLPPGPPMLLGLYDESIVDSANRLGRVRDLEVWLGGRKHAVINQFVEMDLARQADFFAQEAPAIWAHGAVPLVSWTPNLGDDVESALVAGDHDARVDDFRDRLRTWLAGPDGCYGADAGGDCDNDGTPDLADDRRVYLRFAHEMNGAWVPWYNPDPVKFVAMWRYVAGRVNAPLGPTRHLHVQWMWTPNDWPHDEPTWDQQQPDPAPPVSAYYPGDEWVDWVAVDGYNFGLTHTWNAAVRDAPAIFGRIVPHLREVMPSKPLAVAEWGSSSSVARRVVEPAKECRPESCNCSGDLDQGADAVCHVDQNYSDGDGPYWCHGSTSRADRHEDPQCIQHSSDEPVVKLTYDAEAKNLWLAATWRFFAAQQVAMVVAFNHDKETDWQLYGGQRGTERDGAGHAAYESYRHACRDARMVQGDAKAPRRIGDAAFMACPPPSLCAAGCPAGSLCTAACGCQSL